MAGPTVAALLRAVQAALRARLRGEHAFSLVELMVALGVIFVSVTSLAYTATIGFSDIALARQRQAANSLANKLLEQVRALPFDTVRRGLDNADVAAGNDPNIATSGCGTGAAYCFRGEEVVRGDNGPAEPIVPHRATITVGQTTFTRSVYVTYYRNDRTTNAYRLTVVVAWPNPARPGVRSSVEAQTILYSPEGCASTQTHPFAAPCQPFFYAGAQVGRGRIDITGTVDAVAFERGVLWLPGQSSNQQIEQIASVQGEGSTAGLVLRSGGVDRSAGRASTTSLAEDHPVEGNDYDSTSTSAAAPSTLAASGGGNEISLTWGGGDAASTTSTTAASATNVCASELDAQPCGRSATSPPGEMRARLSLEDAALGIVPVATVAPPPAESRAFGHREVAAGVDGSVHSEATRTLGEIRLAELPAGLDPAAVPVGWEGYLLGVTDFTQRVTAQAGTSTLAPTSSMAGTISFWNGSGYSTLALTSVGEALPVAAVHVEDVLADGSTVTIDITAGLRTGGGSISQTAKQCSPTACPDTRLEAEAVSGSPVIGDVRYRVQHAATVVADLNVSVDLGSISARASYTDAPTGG